jgi:ATP-dependent helicase/nuclease subunit A
VSFTVYRSSAGSGKTFTLVREYLKIILNDPRDFRHILAITFTNKAAAEMKERVLHALRELSLAGSSTDKKITGTLLHQLTDETGLTETEIAGRAARVLRLILHNYSDFTIGTIDSFSHRVIRSFAHDFGLPVQFNVELDASEMLTASVDLLLERAGTDAELTRFLVKFLEIRMDEDKGWNIDRILVSFAKVLLDEEGQNHITELQSLTLSDFNRIADIIRSRIGGFEKAVRKIGEEALGVIASAGIEQASFFHGNQGIGKYFEYLATGRTDKLQPNSYVKSTVEEDKWYGGKSSREERDQIDTIKPGLQDLFQETSALLEQSSETYMLNKLLAKTIFPMAVLNEIDRMMTAFKKQSNIIHISEFNRRISSVVMKEPVPFIYERLGERYHHLMIDEFQDTSRLQWQNFIPLLENALASGYFNLVVGDGKQAIYRFRNGDVTQFARLPELEGAGRNTIVKQRQQVLTTHFSEKQLTRNFRSGKEIVEFNNRLFSYLSIVLDEQGQSVYRGLQQESEPGKPGGYVEIKIISNEAEDSTFEELNYTEIFRILAEVKAGGYNAEDIAILCRNNKQASCIARTLLSQGIDVVSSESLLLVQSPEVNFLVACITFLFEQENPVNQAEIAGYLIQSGRLTGVSWPEILQKITSTGKTGSGLVSILCDNGWAFRRAELLTLPLYDLCERLIRLFSLNRSADAYLQFFLDAVLTFVKRDMPGAGNFLDWWQANRLKLSIVVPAGLNAVHIMTIHKSKGLQFPVVIFPFATESKMITKDHLWTDLREQNITGLTTALLKTEAAMEKTVFREQYLEEDRKSMLDLVNLLYVVLTRPEDRLYILTSAPPVKQDGMRSLPSFFAGFLANEGVWEPGKFTYNFGVRAPNVEKLKRESDEPLVLHQFISQDWHDKIRIRSRAPQMWDMESPLEKIQFGNIIHHLLSKIAVREDAPAVIDEAIMAGLISREELLSIQQMFDGIFDHPDIGRLYSGDVEVKTEPGILMPGGDLFRPDRVVFDDGDPVIVEYKTGIRDEKYVGQLSKYADLLVGMGYSNVKKYLVYLHGKVEVIHLD